MQAPDLVLVDHDGRPFRLSQVWAQRPAFLVFYPGDFTPVCTAQLCSYRNHWAQLSQRAELVGINPGSVDAHRRFHDRFALPFPLLADVDGACCRAYGAAAWWGTRRLTVLVDTTGAIRWRRNTFFLFKPSAVTLLAALDRLGGSAPGG